MKCYVISHPESRDISSCKKSLQKFGWDFEIYPAVDGWSLSAADWQKIGVKIGGGKIAARPGAQGCWHSHFDLWQRCIDLGQDIIVLEHDVLVTDCCPSMSDPDTLVKLYTTAPVKTHPIYGSWSKGSHAYILTPKCADQLITFARIHGAQALDKHLGDKVLPWRFYHKDLVLLNPARSRSSTSTARCPWLRQ